MSFEYLKPGDTVTRMLAGTIPLIVIVGKVEDGLIHCGSFTPGVVDVPWENGWTFRVENGAEVDEDLGWDGIKHTGSFLVKDAAERRPVDEKNVKNETNR